MDFEGRQRHYADIAAGASYFQSTYAGHVWRVSSAGKLLGTLVAGQSDGYVDIVEKPPVQ